MDVVASCSFVCALLALSLSARAETGLVNLHLEGGPTFALAGWQAEDLDVGVAGRGGFDLALAPWVGIEASATYLAFFGSEAPAGYEPVDRVSALYAGLGLRFRLLNDENGYALPWGRKPSHVGNVWGNLWIGLDAGYVRTGDLNRFGCGVGIGYEFSLVNALQIGPFARAFYVPQPDGRNDRDAEDAWLMVAGLSVTIAVPPGIRTVEDTDGDGFYDPADGCPNEAEDRDGFEDQDGCPDLDNDGDGVPDDRDECPTDGEDRDGFRDYDGCPDPDNDGDGVLDAADRCPNEVEDKDGFEDADGCPEPDNDDDGVLDPSDQCPNEAEDMNGVEDADGCPEKDSDGDGVLDPLDECPNEAEVINGLDDEDGCMDAALVEVRDREILGGDRIFFDRGMSRIKSRSRLVLQQFARLIQAHPEYEKILIQGHADRTGTEAFNLKLSRERAERVKAHLVGLGVDGARLDVEGAGYRSPWQRGRSREELALNRRVEFYIEEIRTQVLGTAEVQP